MPALAGAVGDWIGRQTGDHCGNYYDLVSQAYATVTRATPKTIFDPLVGRIFDVPAGQLAVNPWGAYQSGGVGFAPVIEEARTNAFLRSYILGATELSAWTADAGLTAALGSSAHGLYGSAVGAVLTADASNRAFWQVVTATATTWVVSFHVRKADGSAVSATDMQLCAVAGTSTPVGTLLTTTFTSLGFGWYRASATFTGTVASWAVGVAVKANKTVTVDCASTGAGAFATSYIPTTTAAATRNADVVTVPTTGWSAAAGTIVATAGAPLVAAGNWDYLSWYASATEYIRLYNLNGSGVIFTSRTTAGGAKYDQTTQTAAPHVIAGTYATGSALRAYVDGTTGVRTDAHSAPSLPATATIGSAAGGAFVNGPIQRVTIFADAKDAATVATYNTLVNGAKAGGMSPAMKMLLPTS